MRDSLGVGLTQTAPFLPILDIAGQISQRSVLGGEQEVALALEDSVEHPEDVVVVCQLQAVLVFSAEILGRHLVGVHGLQHDLLSGDPVFRQPDPAVPAFPEQTIMETNIILMKEIFSCPLERWEVRGVKLKNCPLFWPPTSLCLVHT